MMSTSRACTLSASRIARATVWMSEQTSLMPRSSSCPTFSSTIAAASSRYRSAAAFSSMMPSWSSTFMPRMLRRPAAGSQPDISGIGEPVDHIYV